MNRDPDFQAGREVSPDGAAECSQASQLDDQAVFFGRYRILRELGRGGMGVVFLAGDEELDIEVALKLLPDLVFQDEEALAELKREVLSGIALTHPGIVRTYEFVRDASMAGIVMEYVDGGTFAQVKDLQPGGCFDAEELLPWLEQLCPILDYAHFQARIAHRDLKPSNLMFTSTGHLKVADFGISSVLCETVRRVSVRTCASGTPAYMSPQQVMGEAPSHLDDVYSLGVTIYELLTGRPPFHEGQVLAQVMDFVPPAMAARRIELGIEGKCPIPPTWERTVAACLAKHPPGRPQSAGEVLARLMPGATAPALESVRPMVAFPPAPTGRQGKKRGLLVALALAGVALVTFGLWFKGNRHEPPEGLIPPAPPAQAEKAPVGEDATIDKPSPLPLLTTVKAEDLASAKLGNVLALDLGGGVEMAFCRIPAGRFLMGGADSEPDGNTDETPHEVTLTQPFWLARTEVTQIQWAAVMRDSPSNFTGSELPVEQVSWSDVEEFCRKLTEEERATGALPDGWEFALPTEAQWEHACRAGSSGEAAGSGELDEFGWHGGNSLDTTHPVGTKKANAWGLHDMLGNVAEWCADWHAGYPSGSVADPAGPDTGVDRVIRGGSWASKATDCRATCRQGSEPDHEDRRLGFRIALVPSRPSRQPDPAPEPVAPEPVAQVFSGKLTVNFFAVDANTMAKVPDDILADPARLLESLIRAPNDGRIHRLVSEEVPIEDGRGELENVKPWVYITNFQWQGDVIFPGTSMLSRNIGWNIGISSMTQEADTVKFNHMFEWASNPRRQAIEGFPEDVSFTRVDSMRCGSSAAVHSGESTLAAEWRSETTPPGAKAGQTWQYVLFYTLR